MIQMKKTKFKFEKYKINKLTWVYKELVRMENMLQHLNYDVMGRD